MNVWLYFNEFLNALWKQTNIVLDISEDDFVTMNSHISDDKLLVWTDKTNVSILSLNYKKISEYFYSYVLNKCYDVYHTIVMSCECCLKLSDRTLLKIVITKNNADDNLATELMLMILQTESTDMKKNMLSKSDELILIYSSLNMNIASWMTEEQMSLIQHQNMQKINWNIFRKKHFDYHKLITADYFLCRENADSCVTENYFSQHHKSERSLFFRLENISQVAVIAESQFQQIKTCFVIFLIIFYFNIYISSVRSQVDQFNNYYL